MRIEKLNIEGVHEAMSLARALEQGSDFVSRIAWCDAEPVDYSSNLCFMGLPGVPGQDDKDPVRLYKVFSCLRPMAVDIASGLSKADREASDWIAFNVAAGMTKQ